MSRILLKLASETFKRKNLVIQRLTRLRCALVTNRSRWGYGRVCFSTGARVLEKITSGCSPWVGQNIKNAKMETNNLLLFFVVEWGSRESASIPREIELSRSKSSRRRTITIYHESVCCRGGNVCWVFRITQGAVVSTVCAPGISYQLQKVDKMAI